MECCAAFVRDGLHCRYRVERFSGIDDLAAMGQCCEEPESESKAMKKRWRAAERVRWCKVHAVADEA